jgi:FkbM family methyltransferase
MPALSNYATHEVQFFARLVESGVDVKHVIDVGASDGKWSRAIAPIFPSATFGLFEPLASTREDYREGLAQTLSSHRSMRLHQVALGDADEKASFFCEQHGVGSSLLTDNQPPAQTTRVPVRRLDDFRTRHARPQPQLLKLDVQCGELLALKGAPQTVAAADILHIETWLVRGYGKRTPLLPEVMDHLRPLGHLLVHLGECWRQPDQELIVVDAFFVHTRLVNRLAAASASLPWPANWSPAD